MRARLERERERFVKTSVRLQPGEDDLLRRLQSERGGAEVIEVMNAALLAASLTVMTQTRHLRTFRDPELPAPPADLAPTEEQVARAMSAADQARSEATAVPSAGVLALAAEMRGLDALRLAEDGLRARYSCAGRVLGELKVQPALTLLDAAEIAQLYRQTVEERGRFERATDDANTLGIGARALQRAALLRNIDLERS